MIDLLRHLGKTVLKADHVALQIDGQRADVIVWPSRRWPRAGVILGQEALVLDYRTFMSFRVKAGNLGFSNDLKMAKYRDHIDKEYLAAYFRENSDNPYALYNVIRAIHVGIPLSELTQFPPLASMSFTAESHKEALGQLVEKAELSDIVCSSTFGNSISALIRKEDHGQFSHCSIYVGNGEVVDMETSGATVNSLWNCPPSMRLALYRHKRPLTEEQKRNIASFARERVVKKCRYNYWGVIKVFLRKRFKLPFHTAPSISDLLYSNDLRLVHYV